MLYKHKAKPGKQFELQAVGDGSDQVSLSLGVKKAAPSTIPLNVSQFIDTSVELPLDESQFFETMYSKFRNTEASATQDSLFWTYGFH